MDKNKRRPELLAACSASTTIRIHGTHGVHRTHMHPPRLEAGTVKNVTSVIICGYRVYR